MCELRGRTCLDGSQPLHLPSLEGFQGFLNTFLETKPLSVKFSDSDTIDFVSLLGLFTKPDMSGLSLCVGVQGLCNDIHEIV